MKPENIVMEGGDWGGRLYLVDFGGVQAAAAASFQASTIIGTYGYMVPAPNLALPLLLLPSAPGFEPTSSLPFSTISVWELPFPNPGSQLSASRDSGKNLCVFTAALLFWQNALE